MKQKDIVLIISIAAVSVVISFVVSNKIFVTPSNRAQEVQVVDPITDAFPMPDDKYFNASSINPTQDLQGTDSNDNPFNDSGQ